LLLHYSQYYSIWSISVDNSKTINSSITPTSTRVLATPTATPTQRPTATKIPNPTAATAGAATESAISDATNAGDWVNANAEQRVAIIHYFYELWQKSTGNGVKISEQEMAVCVNTQVASPDTPPTIEFIGNKEFTGGPTICPPEV